LDKAFFFFIYILIPDKNTRLIYFKVHIVYAGQNGKELKNMNTNKWYVYSIDGNIKKSRYIISGPGTKKIAKMDENDVHNVFGFVDLA
jgi:hypothetical protein